VERSARDDPDGEYLKRNRWFESGSLQQRVCELSVPERRTDRREKHRQPLCLVSFQRFERQLELLGVG
jgi:hypothetical protein